MPARDVLAAWRAARATAAPEVAQPEAPPPPPPADPARPLAEALAADRPVSDPAAGCAWCGGGDQTGGPLVPFGEAPRVVWAHWQCWHPWQSARRGRVADELRDGLLRGFAAHRAGSAAP